MVIDRWLSVKNDEAKASEVVPMCLDCRNKLTDGHNTGRVRYTTFELSIAVLVSYPSSASELGAGGVTSPFWMLFALCRISDSILVSYKSVPEALGHSAHKVLPKRLAWSSPPSP